MAKLNNKYDNFSNAVNRLNEANIAYKRNPENDIYQDALIKRFEFTFELAWKTLREFLIDQGYRLEIASPKNVIAFAYREGILSNEELWLDMLAARNNTAHDYGRELSAQIANDISNRYSKELTALKKLIFDNI